MVKKLAKNVYLDYAATTPTRPEVIKAMAPFWNEEFGNPSSLYGFGARAKAAVDEARKSVAQVFGGKQEEFVFTAGGSESLNLAIIGAARAYRKQNKFGGHIISSNIEHKTVLECLNQLESEGFSITKLNVDNQGFFKVADVQKAIEKDTFLVTLIYTNNEIGTVEPISEIGKMLIGLNKKREKEYLPKIYFHTDACQAAGLLDINVHKLGVDMLSINGSKIYGPKQTGCLYVKKGTNLEPVIYGGGQEKGLRSGTENVPGIIGFAKALELAQKDKVKEAKRLIQLRDWFIKEVTKKIADIKLNGPVGNSRLANNISLSFKGCDGEALMFYLDAKGFTVSTGSACTSSSSEPSHVLEAIGLDSEYISGSIRITLGRYVAKQDLVRFLNILPGVIGSQRKMSNVIK